MTEADKTNLLATALEIAVRFMFKNHVYSFANENYKQSDSGPCGMRSTMAISRLVTGEWGEKMRAILAKADIKNYMDGLFVDDGRFLVSSLPHGMRWSTRGKEFIFSEDWKKEDEESGESTGSFSKDFFSQGAVN